MSGRSWGRALLCVGIVAGFYGCDSTVGLDVTRPTFTKLIAPGACKVREEGVVALQEIDLSLLLLDGTDAILPDDRLKRETRPVFDLLTDNLEQSFRFARPANAMVDVAQPAFAQDSEGTIRGVGLQPRSLQFLPTGGASRSDDDLLIVFALDHSGSLIGLDPRPPGGVDLARGSDPKDERITFFTQAIEDFPENAFMSVVSFAGDFANVTADCSTPTLNRDQIRTCLTDLQRGENGFTPLADALDKSLRQVIRGNDDLNPVIVLFTDGTEDEGDVSVKSLGDVKRDLVEAEVPVVVIHLKPLNPDFPEEVRDRSAEYQDLACETGGEYLFVERAEQLSDERTSSLQAIVTNRVSGVWRLRTETTLAQDAFPPEAYLLSTEVTVTLTGKSRSFALTRKQDVSEFNDTRLWFKKQ